MKELSYLRYLRSIPDPYKRLGYAIILQAVEDWREAVDPLERKEIESFFHSELYHQITDLHADYLINRLKKGLAIDGIK